MKRIAEPTPKLEIRDLQTVMAIAASGSTVKAAAALHVTQSAVSRGLILAEEKLGTRLFERTPRGLVPTAAGERLIGGAGALLSQLVDLEVQAKAPGAEPARVRLVCECYTAYRWLPSALAQLRRTLPLLDVVLAPEHTQDPVAGLLEGVIDVAFLTTSRVPKPLAETALFSDELVFVLAPNHPLAARTSLSSRDLREHPLITSTLAPKPAVSWFLDRVFGKARPRLETIGFPLTEAMMDGARAGMGVAVLSEWIAIPYLGSGDLVVRRLRGRPLERSWRMAFRREAAEDARRQAAALLGAPPRQHP